MSALPYTTPPSSIIISFSLPYRSHDCTERFRHWVCLEMISRQCCVDLMLIFHWSPSFCWLFEFPKGKIINKTVSKSQLTLIRNYNEEECIKWKECENNIKSINRRPLEYDDLLTTERQRWSISEWINEATLSQLPYLRRSFC